MKNVVLYSPWIGESFSDIATPYVAAAQTRTHKPVHYGGRAVDPANLQKTYRFVSYNTQRQLGFTQEGDRLYILGHGIEAAELIRADDFEHWDVGHPDNEYYTRYVRQNGTAVYALTPDQLIALLEYEQLNSRIRDVRLWICKGGREDFSRFAWEFTGRMLAKFPLVRVTAYAGFMTIGRESGRRWGSSTPEEESTAAKNYRMVVNDDPLYRRSYQPDDE